MDGAPGPSRQQLTGRRSGSAYGTARTGALLDQPSDLVERGGHLRGPGCVPVGDDPHRREPFADESDESFVGTERDKDVGSFGVDLSDGAGFIRRSGSELPSGRDGRLLQLRQRRTICGDAEHLHRATHGYSQSFRRKNHQTPAAAANIPISAAG